MAEQQVRQGETWRRKKDGALVTISAVQPWYTEFDIHWRAVEGNRRGAIWQFNFLKTYERVPASADAHPVCADCGTPRDEHDPGECTWRDAAPERTDSRS